MIPFKILLPVLVLLSSSAAYAQVVVWPTKLNVGAGPRVNTVRIENRSDEEKRYEVSTSSWSKSAEDGGLMASPPVLILKSGQTGTIKVAAKSSATNTEIGYRLLVDDISASNAKMGFSIPVFVAKSASTEPELVASCDGKIVAVKNEGSGHALINKIEENGVSRQAHLYVLPGEQVEIEASGKQMVLTTTRGHAAQATCR